MSDEKLSLQRGRELADHIDGGSVGQAAAQWMRQAIAEIEMHRKWFEENAGYLASHNVGGFKFL